MTRFDKSIDWLEMYVSERESMQNTMIRNMSADLDAGYDYFGKSIKQQRAAIDEFRAKFDAVLDMFKTMTDDAVQHWCFYELKKLGAIE